MTVLMSTTMDAEQIKELRSHARRSLGAWTEPTYDQHTGIATRAGSLYCTEPDSAQRALTRIELRTAIDVLTRVLDESVDEAAHRRAQHSDLQRIIDDGVEAAATRDSMLE